MKKRLFNFIIDACRSIDKKRGKLDHYEYETAPYCGHHYSGAKGVLYRAEYHEGEGCEYADILGFRFGRDTDDDYFSYFKYALIVRLYFEDETLCSSFRINRSLLKRKNLKVLRNAITLIRGGLKYKLKFEKR